MEIVKKPIKNIVLLWKQPKPSHTIYRPMRFVLRVKVDEGLLLYNIITSEMILLDKDEGLLFDRLPALYRSEMNELIAHHFIVKEGFEEEKSVKELRAILKKLNPSKSVNGFTILPTTECNARCYYCFESNHKRCTLTDEMVPDVVEYINNKSKKQPIDITWFGGEPLVGRKQISQICAGLKQKEVVFKSTMVSNAYLFDQSIIEEAKNDWNLKSVQITLDGTEKVYNETKAYINPKDNPFKRVLRNIELLLDNGLAVNVRLNVTDKNMENLSELIDLLSDCFGNRKGFSCYSHAVYEGVGFSPLEYDDLKREEVDIATAELDTKLMEKGLLGSYSRLPNLRFINCMSDNDSARVIYPDGKIGKCENQSSSAYVGNIYDDITEEEMNEKYKVVKYIKECENCPLFPSCVNLNICPDTGKCTDVKVSWRVKRYNSLMKELYGAYKENKQIDVDEGIIAECDS